MPSSCRSCGSADLQPILSLGALPPANALLDPAQLAAPEPRYPLDLVLCPACGLVQITETLPPEQLFRDYVYFSSVSETMLANAAGLVERLARDRHLDERNFVVEIGSNDGYLLQFYRRRGIPVLGIEPAVNIARFAHEHMGIPTRNDFFGAELAADLVARGPRADVIHAHNVLAHVADVNGVVRGIERLLDADGVAIIEVPYVRDLVERGEFDTIYHEHLCYFSLTSLTHLFERHGLAVRDVERLDIHGGSLRLFVGKAGPRAASVNALLAEEQAVGLCELSFFEPLAERATSTRKALRSLLHGLKQQGRRIVAYGAAAKGATLLGYCGLGTEVLEYVVDRNVHKQGKYLPGVRVPICSPERLLEEPPDYLLVLAWNIAEEVMAQQAEFRARGGQFILPIPSVRVVAAG